MVKEICIYCIPYFVEPSKVAGAFEPFCMDEAGVALILHIWQYLGVVYNLWTQLLDYI